MKKLFLILLVIMVGVCVGCASVDCPREDLYTVIHVMGMPVPVHVPQGQFNEENCGWQSEHTHVTMEMWEAYQEKLKEDPTAMPDGYVDETESEPKVE